MTVAAYTICRIAGVGHAFALLGATMLVFAAGLVATPRHALAQGPGVSYDTTARARLLAAIRGSSYPLIARRAALDAAQARLRAAGFGPAFSLEGGLEEVPRGLSVGAAGSARIELSRDLVPRDLRAARRALAATDVEQAKVELDVTDRALVARVHQVLVSAAAWLLIARRLAAEDSLLLGAEGSIRARFVVGDARYVDVLRVRTARLGVQAERAAALSEASTNRRVLLTLVSARSAAHAEIVDSALADLLMPITAALAGHAPWEPLLAAPNVDSLVAVSGAVRLAAVQATRAAVLRSVTLAERRSQWKVSLGAQRFEKNPGQYTVGPTLGFSVSLPFTAQRAINAAVGAAEQDVNAARASERAATLAARLELSAARDRYEAARERLALYDAALLRGAREERETALASYRSGELSLVALLDFERALARAEIAQLHGRVEAANALADLLAGAAGGVELRLNPNEPAGLQVEVEYD